MPTNLNPDPWIPAYPASPLWPAAAVQVYRVTPTSSPTSGPPTMTMTLLESVEAIAVKVQEGPDPGGAQFRYRFGDGNTSSPQSVEQALSTAYTTSTLPDLVEIGDWLAVLVTNPVTSTSYWLFSGFPLEWEGDLGPNLEQVTINATGVAKRLWDTPFAGALVRNSDAPETGGNDVPTDLIPQFNPRGRSNASPSTGDSGSGSFTYPVFLDPDVTGTDTASNPYPQMWDLEGAIAHLLYTGNPTTYWVSNPTRTTLQSLLISREPITGTPFDPTNSATYTAAPIAASDDPLSGKALPILVHDQVKDSGFGMAFVVAGDSSGPTTALNLFLKQAGTVKSIYLATRFSALDTGANNVAAARMARDLSGVVNQWTVDGGLGRYEVSFVLFNAFPSASGDAASLANFVSSAAGFDTSANYDTYRTFILDESGEGHYTNLSTTKATTPTSLDAVLGAPAGSPPVAQYVKRRRPPIGDLLSVDDLGKRLKWRLHVSTAYTGPQGVWDGTATDWQLVAGNVELLKDRVGFRFSGPDPNAWNIGKAVAGPFKDGKLNLVEKIAGGATISFRLTCVIEADQGLTYTAAPIGTSPISETIERRIDARDRYRKETIYAPSANLSGSTNTVTRDDTAYATSEAIAFRTAMDSGVFECEVEIPYITTYYQIGDKIDQINGRGLGFRTDTGGAGYLPVLPIVAGIRWEFAGGQKTVLTLSDTGLDRRRYRNKKSAAQAQVKRNPEGMDSRWRTDGAPRSAWSPGNMVAMLPGAGGAP